MLVEDLTLFQESYSAAEFNRIIEKEMEEAEANAAYFESCIHR